MIERIISPSRISEVDWVTERIIGAYKKTSLESDQYMNRIIGDLEALSVQLTQATNPQKALSKLEEKDAIRDNSVRSLYFNLKSEILNQDAEISAAAESLLKVFKPFGLSIVEENYAMESNFINSLLMDYSAQEFQEAIAMIPGCAGKIAAVKIAQDEFNAASISYGVAKGEESNLESASKIKDKVMELVNGILVPYLGAVAKLEGGEFAAFARSANEYIAQNNEIVRKRHNKSVPVAE